MVCLWRQLVDVWAYVPIPLSFVVFVVAHWRDTKRLVASEVGNSPGIRLNDHQSSL